MLYASWFMSDSQIEEVKSKLDVVEVVGSYVKLTKTGLNYRGICPFHSEKKPSFFVSPTRQMWHCFGCGAGFSIFDFVMKIEGIEFGDALRMLAAKAGVQLKQENPQLRTERQRLLEICDLATKFFEKQLESGVGTEAEAYLLQRGITKESIKKWRLGYSPDTWQGLSDFLVGKGYQRQEIVKAGLAIPKDNNPSESYDRFRGRIMFPVFDLNAQVVGFGGRVFKKGVDDTAKYINTPQTLLYDKSGVLYGLHHAKLAIRKHNRCVVTEGYTDVIMCHQAGFENTVAASGTALTARHLVLLKRYSENLLLAFDADMAGDSATKRGIANAQGQGFNIKIIEAYLKDADPADVILKDPALWEEALEKARGIMEYYFDSAFSSFDRQTPEGKKAISKILLPAIAQLQNRIEQSHWAQKLAEMLGIREEVISEELLKISSHSSEGSRLPEAPGAAAPIPVSLPPEVQRKRMIEERIVSLVLQTPSLSDWIGERDLLLFSEPIQLFLKEAKRLIATAPAESDNLAQQLSDGVPLLPVSEEVKNLLVILSLQPHPETAEEGEVEMKLCLTEFKAMELKNKLSLLSGEIKKAQTEQDAARISALMEEFNKLSQELRGAL
jgi:DNA primase